jgi:hypothetical protein
MSALREANNFAYKYAGHFLIDRAARAKNIKRACIKHKRAER